MTVLKASLRTLKRVISRDLASLSDPGSARLVLPGWYWGNNLTFARCLCCTVKTETWFCLSFCFLSRRCWQRWEASTCHYARFAAVLPAWSSNRFNEPKQIDVDCCTVLIVSLARRNSFKRFHSQRFLLFSGRRDILFIYLKEEIIQPSRRNGTSASYVLLQTATSPCSAAGGVKLLTSLASSAHSLQLFTEQLVFTSPIKVSNCHGNIKKLTDEHVASSSS